MREDDHRFPPRLTARAPAAIAAAAAAALVLAACGSSSTTSATGSASTTKSTASRTGGPGGGRFSALRECLKKQGIELPQRTPGKTGGGAPPQGGAVPFGGGSGGPRFQLPKGVTRSQFEAAMNKCGGGRGFGGGSAASLRSPTFTKALAKFAECMRQNGVPVPKPNTSGKGPIFSTKGLDTKSAKFREAQKKCASLLNVARPGAGATPPPGGAPAG
jgi:hypothetical protein